MRTWVWVGHVWSARARLALEHYGDQITDVSIFGWFVNARGEVSLTFDPELLLPYREKWPHMRFWLAFRNDGNEAIFSALQHNADAQARLLAGLEAALVRYPWLDGIDIDLERGGAASNAVPTERLFRRIADLAHRRGLECAAALPPLTSTGSIGGEDWVRYRQLGEFLDHLAIMSYDFAWSGSAPGPVSPGYWMEDVYDWVTSQVAPHKILMGLPLYSYFWDLHNYPAALGHRYRGESGTYYAAWQKFTGYRAYDGTDGNPGGSGSHHKIGWLAFRDPDSMAAWGFMDVYDWRWSADWDAGSNAGIITDLNAGKPYTARYGRPSGVPMWSVADNSGEQTGATYSLTPRSVVDVEGRSVSPKRGYTCTVELLKRYPVAATIIDDNASTADQLAAFYRQPSGSWGRWADGDRYSQYRGTGQLNFAHDFGGRSIYLQIRAQFASPGWTGVTVRGITAEVHPSGRLRVRRGSTVLQEVGVAARAVGAAAGTNRFYVGLRVREGSARAYFGLTDVNALPLVARVDTTPSGGTVGIVSEGTAWIDHVYAGDGWWYQPREAVRVTVGGQSRVLGRLPRAGVTWDSSNRFRPSADVDEWETRDDGYSLDWAYDHWVDAPFVTDRTAAVRVAAIDHDVWFSRALVVDRDGGGIAYWSDAETVVHWRDRAHFDYGVSGIALWTLGQEDMRTWDRLADGALPPATKVLNA
ncbi:hypothetical protein A9Z40_03170 [Microbacterium arborescens]|uniref:GH18 domain-containing protein n=1 Tax=Microbacterium arborescens TaxID=33883 RepID=A0ABX2WIQ5_9MICO|nr:glycosyl hydrolase family 18 protein [Microbacterium arborescens]OAZ40956.1 hypothetical protein A9Z40_03170 [Microbacterium arborescens]